MKRVQDALPQVIRTPPTAPETASTAAVTSAGMPLAEALDNFETVGRNVLAGVGRSLFSSTEDAPGAALVAATKNPYGENDNARFLAQTQAFRDDITHVRSAKAALDAASPTDPSYPKVKAAFDAADQRLTDHSGYRLATLPPEGTLFLDPQYEGGDFADGQVRASRFPAQTPISQPPTALKALFDSHTPVRLLDAEGSVVNVPNEKAYVALVAKNRADAQMPLQGGDPVAVHMTFEGGGGKGKRYAPVLSEMVRLGVVPASVSGNSVGAIAAGMVAAGAKPADLADIINSPEVKEFQDADLTDGGGLFNGDVAYAFFDRKLRELTGITDRPVTFADLKIPLQIVAATLGDSAPPKGKEDLSQRKNRTFVFSQETTPNTPVALAIQASMNIPGVFNPIQMVDPTTGRQLSLVDGGVMDALPMGYEHNALPQIGLTLYEPDSDHPASAANTRAEEPLPTESIDSHSTVVNAYYGYTMHQKSGAESDDFRDRTQPKAGQFMFGVPVWNLKDPTQADTTLKFPPDPKIDPALDVQTRALTQAYLKDHLGKLQDPTARATNTLGTLPEDTRFTRPVTLEGKPYTARYAGGDQVRFLGRDGKAFDVKLGRQNIESMVLDDLTFHDLPAKLAWQVAESKKPFWEKIHLPI